MVVKLFLLILTAVFLGSGLNSKSYGWIKFKVVYQFVFFLILYLQKLVMGTTPSQLDSLFYLSIFILPLFFNEEENVGTHGYEKLVQYLLLPSFFLIQSLFKMDFNQACLGLGALVVFWGLRDRRFSSLLLGLFVVLILTGKLTVENYAYEVVTPLLALLALYLFTYPQKGSYFARPYFFICLVLMTGFDGGASDLYLRVAQACILVPHLLLIKEEMERKALLAAVFVSIHSYYENVLTMLPLAYFIITYTSLLIGKLKTTVSLIEFKDGSLTISYQQVIFIFLSLLLMVGVYPTLYGYKITGEGELLPGVSYLIFGLPVILRFMILSSSSGIKAIKDCEILIFIVTLVTILMSFSLPRESYGFSLLGIVSLIILVMNLVLIKKGLIGQSFLPALLEKYTIHPLVNQTSLPEKLSIQGKKGSLSLSWVSAPRYSYSITVGFVFIFISLVFWGLLR